MDELTPNSVGVGGAAELMDAAIASRKDAWAIAVRNGIAPARQPGRLIRRWLARR